MLRLVAARLALFPLTLLAASLVLFIAINVVPGSAARSALGVDATAQAIMRFEALNGLDRPLYVQYGEWLGRALHGDFGVSFQNRVPVGPEIAARLPVTLELAVLAFLVANMIAIPLGALAALFHQRRADTVISTLATIFGAIPSFWLATLLVLLFALAWRLLPSGGYVPLLRDPERNLTRMALPALSLGIASSALLTRIMRTAMLEVLSSDYIRTAYAKGASRGVVVMRHALRNALIPFLTVGAVEFGFLFGGVVIIEDIFRLPGIGSLVLVGIINRDYPVLLAAALVVTLVVLTANMLVDIAASLLDPRHVRARDSNRMSDAGRLQWRRHRLLVTGGLLVATVVLAALLAPLVAPCSPYDLDVAAMLQPPSGAHLLGTDEVGRDVLSRTIYAARISVEVALVAVSVGVAGGMIVGVLSAYLGGLVDLGLMRLMELLFSFPAILLAVVLMASLGTSILNAMIAIGIVFIPGFARLARIATMQVLRQQYVDAARTIGMSDARILLREILPNVVTPVLVEAAVAFSYAVILESALSFLGLGAQPPEPSWGNMLNTGRGFMGRAPWLGIVPGVALFLCVLGFNLLGDGLRDALDPHLRE